MMKNTEQKTFEFQAIRFVPGYNDFDLAITKITAASEEQAMKKFRALKWIYKSLYVTELESTPQS